MNLPKRRKPPRSGIRDEDGPLRVPQFLKFVRAHECAAYAAKESNRVNCQGSIEAAHVRVGTDGGIGLKPSDCYALPLCSYHHARQHQIGERSFEKETGVTMRATADGLWAAWLKTVTGNKWKLAHG